MFCIKFHSNLPKNTSTSTDSFNSKEVQLEKYADLSDDEKSNYEKKSKIIIDIFKLYNLIETKFEI